MNDSEDPMTFPKAKIHKLTKAGILIVRFSEEMLFGPFQAGLTNSTNYSVTPVNLTQDMLNITILPGIDSDPEKLGLSWQLKAVSNTSLTF